MRFKPVQSISIILLLCFVLLASGIIFIASPSGSRFLLSEIKSQLSSHFDTELSYSEGKLELTSGFHFKDLKIKRKTPAQQLALQIQNLDCDYTLFWWARKIQIQKFSVVHPSVEIFSGGEPTAKEPESSKSLLWLEKVPVAIEVQNFTMTGLNLTDGRATGKTQVKKTDAQGIMDFHSNHISLAGAFHSDVDFSSPSLGFHMASKGKWDFSLESRNHELNYDVRTAEISVFLDQLVLASKPGEKEKITIRSQDFLITTDATKKTIALHYLLHGLSMPSQLKKSVDIEWLATLQGKNNFEETEIQSRALLEKIPLFSLNGKLRGLNEFSMQAEWFADTRLSGFVTSAAILKKTGTLHGTLDWNGKVTLPLQLESKLSATIPGLRMEPKSSPWNFKLDGDLHWLQSENETNWKGSIEAQNTGHGTWIAQTEFKNKGLESSSEMELRETTSQFLLEPVHVSHRFSPTALHAEIKAPRMHFPQVGTSEDFSVILDGESSNFANANDFVISAALQEGRFIVENKAKSSPISALEGLSASGKLKLSNGSLLVLEALKASSNHSLLTLQGNGLGNLKTKDYQAHLDLGLNIPGDFPAIQGARVKGKITVPVNFSFLQNRDLNIKGAIELHHLDASQGMYSMQDLSGRIPFEEKMILESGNKIRLTELITQNPFERVNFERLRPLLQGADQLSIQSLHWEEKSYGPFVGFISLNQNLLFIHQFDLDLGAGRISGEFFFDSYPTNLQVGVLARLTQLNLNEVLPKRYLFRIPAGNKTISGRSGFVVNLNKGSMDGRIDITEIGNSQLITLINLLDPVYENEKMNRLRGILDYAYPTAVAVSFADGYMDMDIDLKAIGLSARESLRGVPVSHFILQASESTAAPKIEKPKKENQTL